MSNVYLAGPMRGMPDLNRLAFHAAAKTLREEGHIVFNPAEQDIKQADLESDISVTRNCFLHDTQWICQFADIIALLPGWVYSRGAKAEKALGEAIGLEIRYL